MKKRLVISFSGRKDGNCDRVGRLAADILQGRFVRFADLKVEPCGDCDYECMKRGASCPKDGGVFDLYDQIAGAEKCIFVLPNYADYPCAQFFVFAERGTGWFDGSEERLARYMRVPKKAVVISGSEQENFRRILAYQADKMEIMFLRAKDFGQSSLEGRLTDSEEACARIRAFLQG